jgi:hypothetical protein
MFKICPQIILIPKSEVFMKKLALLLVVASLFVASSAMAGISGNTLLHYCNDALKYIENSSDPSVSKSNYLKCSGVLGETLKKGDGDLFCIPPKTSLSQLAKIVVTFSKDHRELLHHESTSLINNAAIEAFPCIESTPAK